MVISLWQRCSPEDTAPNSLGDAEAKGEIQGAMATHTMLGTLKKQERTLCHGQLCHGHVQPQSKVHARLEVGCSYPKHPTKRKEKSPGFRARDPERVLTDLRGLIRAVWTVPFPITSPALRDAGDLVSAGKLLRAARFRG